jgi:hypothetical protein
MREAWLNKVLLYYTITKLSPLLFLILINDFKPTNDITKFVDDSSLFEVVLQNTRSKLDQTLSKTSEWVDCNYMELNGGEKELRITFSDHNFDLGNH